MKPPENIRNLFPQETLRLSIGVVLCVLVFGSMLLAQQPLRAPKPNSDLQPLRAPDPVEELETVAPDSAAIPKSWFKDVQVTPTGIGILVDEVPAYFRILDHLRTVPPENLEKADREFRLERIEEFGERKRKDFQNQFKNETQRESLLNQLEKRVDDYREDPASYPLVRDAFNQSKACQGNVVSFSGHVRRTVAGPAGKNEYGFDQLYEVWLFDEESKGYPVIIVCSELPEGFPVDFTDTETIDGVSVRGYFFKLYAYEGGERYHAIPMILAKTIEWNPPPALSRSVPTWAYGIAIGLGIVALWLIIRSNRSTKPLRSVPPPEDNPFQ